MSQGVFVKLGHAVWVDRSWEEVREALVPPGSSTVSRSAIFVQSDEVVWPLLTVPVQVGRVGVVPVLLEVLMENTLCRQLFLQEIRRKVMRLATRLKDSDGTLLLPPVG